MVLVSPPESLMATASSSQEEKMGTLIQTIRQEFHKTLPQKIQNTSNSRPNSPDGRFVRFSSPRSNIQSANTNQNQNYRNFNKNNGYNKNPINRYSSSGNQQNNRYNNNSNTSNQQQNRSDKNQQPFRHCNRTNHQSKEMSSLF